jgi:hypothetical protein
LLLQKSLSYELFMYKEHFAFQKPENLDAMLWRYLDFTKFVSLIDKKALFFVRADKLQDPFEGAVTKIDKKLREDFIEKYYEKHGLRPTPLGGPHFKLVKKWFVINSWHMSEHESAAMWKLYLKSEEGVAIQTTFRKLAESFKYHREDEIYIGMVEYTDYESEKISEKHKRRSFDHEKEVRAIIMRTPPPEDQRRVYLAQDIFDGGLYVDVDLDLLVEKVYISPYSKEWFCELVMSITNKYELKANVVPSTLSEEPIF